MGRDKNSFIAAKRLDGDGKLLVSRMWDMLSVCEKSFSPVFSGFLSEGEQALSEEFLSYMGAERYELFGGYEGAMRRILCIYPEYMQPEEKAILEELGETLGSTDVQGQLESLGAHRDALRELISEAERERREKGRLYRILGVTAGLFAAVILI